MDVDEQPLRVMADSDILIAGVLKPRWFFEFLSHAIRGDFQLVLAPQTVAEVLRWAETKGGRRKDALEFFLARCRFELAPDPSPEEVQTHTALVRDVTDVPVALSAIKARVDYLVTNDDDFHAHCLLHPAPCPLVPPYPAPPMPRGCSSAAPTCAKCKNF